MKFSQLNKSRFIVGIVLVVVAVLMFLFPREDTLLLVRLRLACLAY